MVTCRNAFSGKSSFLVAIVSLVLNFSATTVLARSEAGQDSPDLKANQGQSATAKKREQAAQGLQDEAGSAGKHEPVVGEKDRNRVKFGSTPKGDARWSRNKGNLGTMNLRRLDKDAERTIARFVRNTESTGAYDGLRVAIISIEGGQGFPRTYNFNQVVDGAVIDSAGGSITVDHEGMVTDLRTIIVDPASIDTRQVTILRESAESMAEQGLAAHLGAPDMVLGSTPKWPRTTATLHYAGHPYWVVRMIVALPEEHAGLHTLTVDAESGEVKSRQQRTGT